MGYSQVGIFVAISWRMREVLRQAAPSPVHGNKRPLRGASKCGRSDDDRDPDPTARLVHQTDPAGSTNGEGELLEGEELELFRDNLWRPLKEC